MGINRLYYPRNKISKDIKYGRVTLAQNTGNCVFVKLHFHEKCTLQCWLGGRSQWLFGLVRNAELFCVLQVLLVWVSTGYITRETKYQKTSSTQEWHSHKNTRNCVLKFHEKCTFQCWLSMRTRFQRLFGWFCNAGFFCVGIQDSIVGIQDSVGIQLGFRIQGFNTFCLRFWDSGFSKHSFEVLELYLYS